MSIEKISTQLKTNEAQLSNKEITDLLRLALKHTRSSESLFEIFDEILSERVSASGINNEDFAYIMEVIADHNQSCT